MFTYKLLNGQGGLFIPDNKEITAKEACQELKKKHKYLQQKDDNDVKLMVRGKILDDNAKLKDYGLENICCVHVLSVANKEKK